MSIYHTLLLYVSQAPSLFCSAANLFLVEWALRFLFLGTALSCNKVLGTSLLLCPHCHSVLQSSVLSYSPAGRQSLHLREHRSLMPAQDCRSFGPCASQCLCILFLPSSCVCSDTSWCPLTHFFLPMNIVPLQVQNLSYPTPRGKTLNSLLWLFVVTSLDPCGLLFTRGQTPSFRPWAARARGPLLWCLFLNTIPFRHLFVSVFFPRCGVPLIFVSAIDFRTVLSLL